MLEKIVVNSLAGLIIVGVIALILAVIGAFGWILGIILLIALIART